MSGALRTPRLASNLEVSLSQREGEVLRQMTRGLTNKQIAQTMSISYETVKEHVQHVLRKIGLTDRTQAAVWAVRNRCSVKKMRRWIVISVVIVVLALLAGVGYFGLGWWHPSHATISITPGGYDSASKPATLKEVLATAHRRWTRSGTRSATTRPSSSSRSGSASISCRP